MDGIGWSRVGVWLGLAGCCWGLGAVELRKDEDIRFKLPHLTTFRWSPAAQDASRGGGPRTGGEWIEAKRGSGGGTRVRFGSRVVVRIAEPGALGALIGGLPLRLSRTIAPDLFILQAPDAPAAIRVAEVLSREPGVLAAYPVFQEAADLNGPYAPLPNDQYYYLYMNGQFFQWYLESRDPATEQRAGFDLNVRAAWPFSRGAGVTVAVADLGVELDHPDLVARTAGAPHHDFVDDSTNGSPRGTSGAFAHGTEVAGLAAATMNNTVGMAGVAPEAGLASWLIVDASGLLVTDEKLMEMFQFASNTVAVQNHSWSKGTSSLVPLSALELAGIDNAVSLGRDGRGVVMIRASGNRRVDGDNGDDDAYVSDPRVIAVSAVRADGRVAGYSEPGACILVAAPSGDSGLPGLFTTDLTGTDGVNIISFLPPYQDLSDYAYGGVGFSGTSAAAPQVCGVVALLLAANPRLAIRDVQQILALSARHTDAADPDVSTNGAGFRVSHNVGFGVPDAGEAVRLAQGWSNRPVLASVILTNATVAAIPDDGLRVEVAGPGIPPELASIRAITSTGPHADDPLPFLPLVDCGLCTNRPSADLTGKGALILRGILSPYQKAQYAADAGAAFAVVYNYLEGDPNACPGGDQLCPVGGADFVPIPVVFIGHTDGTNLLNVVASNPAATARIHLTRTNRIFDVVGTLTLEHVGVRVKTDHPLRGDLRIALVSPAGTRSVLQRYNADTEPGPVDWTYWSTHHFFEGSAGRWTVEVADEYQGELGSVLEVQLLLRGVPIVDVDRDGLDDAWEISRFETLSLGPTDDPDRDGSNNAREQAAGTDPISEDVAFELDLSEQRPGRHRLSWPTVEGRQYEIWSGTNVTSFSVTTNLPGRFPESEWTFPTTNPASRFFRVGSVP